MGRFRKKPVADIFEKTYDPIEASDCIERKFKEAF
jgi:hypothetical protein